MDLSDALRRRGGGFQVGGLLDASAHEKTRSFLIKHLRKESPRADLVGPSIDEILECDKAIFVALQKKCDRDPTGLASLALHIDNVLDNGEILAMVGYHLTPSGGRAQKRGSKASSVQPVAKVKAGANPSKSKAKKDRQKQRAADDRAELERLRAAAAPNAASHNPSQRALDPLPPPGGWKGGKKGGKGKGKGKA